MARKFSLLCYGHDQTLLETRRMILATSFRVEIACSLAEIARLGNVIDVDLVLICHTVPEPECRQVIQITGALWPRSGILSIQPITEDSRYRDCLLPHYQVDAAPQHLKDRIIALLSQQEFLSRSKSA